eukprot:3491732-Prymnesium_polylepis.1
MCANRNANGVWPRLSRLSDGVACTVRGVLGEDPISLRSAFTAGRSHASAARAPRAHTRLTRGRRG